MFISLVVSLLLNVVLIYLLVMSERMNHSIEIALDKRGLVQMNEKHRPDYRMQQGWTNSIEKQHKQYDVAFFGNSLTYNSDFQRYYPDLAIINLGVSGNTLKDMRRRISTLVAANPKKVFIMAGANDLLIESIDEYEEDYMNVINNIKKFLPMTRIYVQSMLPMNASAGYKQVPSNTIIEANRRIRILSEKMNVTYVDIFSSYAIADTLKSDVSDDGLHLIPDSYCIWGDVIKKFIYQ